MVEIINDAGQVLPPGVAGEIVVTHLATNDFPFIRYRTGDVGVLDDKLCSCGRTLPLLKEIQGRSTDFVAVSYTHLDVYKRQVMCMPPAGHWWAIKPASRPP